MDAAKIINRSSAQCIDGLKMRRAAIMEKRAEKRQKEMSWVESQLALTRIVADKNTSPATIERQLGQAYTRTQFEALVKKLNPAISLEANPHGKNERYAGVYWVRNGKKVKVGGCERDVMPEYSVMELDEVELPLITNHMDYDTPAFVKEKTPGVELYRGWRTILIQLVAVGALTLHQVENFFGASNRASWAHHMKKQGGLGLPF